MDQPRPRRATWRIGARERNRLQILAIAIILFLLFLAFRPYFLTMAETRDLQVCEDHARKIARGLAMYADMWDGAYPPASTWMTCIEQNVQPTSGTGFKRETYFKCPKDHSDAPSSYVYNDLVAGLSFGEAVRSSDPATEARRKSILNPSRVPVVFEHHGSANNAHMLVPGYDELQKVLQLPHDLPPPTGVIVTGSNSVERRNQEQLQAGAGRHF